MMILPDLIVTADNKYRYFIGLCSENGFFIAHKMTLWEGIEFVRITQNVFNGCFVSDTTKIWVEFPSVEQARGWLDLMLKYFCPYLRSRIVDEKKN